MEKMTLSALVTLLLIFGTVITEGSLFTLQKMIKQVTGKRAVPNYFAYGCYCGWGGSGKPLDDTDCGDSASNSPPHLVRFVAHTYKRRGKWFAVQSLILSYFTITKTGEQEEVHNYYRIRCCHAHDCCYNQTERQGCSPKSSDYSYTYQSGNVNCGRGTSCQQQICECDRDLVLCLKKHLGSFRKGFRFHWNLFCRGSTPVC